MLDFACVCVYSVGIDRKKYKNINNLKHLLKPLKLDIGSRNRLSISYFENPGHFFCQVYS